MTGCTAFQRFRGTSLEPTLPRESATHSRTIEKLGKGEILGEEEVPIARGRSACF